MTDRATTDTLPVLLPVNFQQGLEDPSRARRNNPDAEVTDDDHVRAMARGDRDWWAGTTKSGGRTL